MNLDEAIKHAEEIAKEQEKGAKECHENQVRKCELFPFAEMDYTHENECKKCAADHRQLAEWLKELKVYKEKESLDPSEELAKAFTIGMAMGFGKKYDEMDKIMEAIKALAPKPKIGRWIPTGYDGYADGNPCL